MRVCVGEGGRAGVCVGVWVRVCVGGGGGVGECVWWWWWGCG